jgi:homopolymeric O-antigen transport system permease protein
MRSKQLIEAGSPVSAHDWPLVDPRQRLIQPARRRVRVRDLPGYVEVIRVLAGRDFKVKYQQSILGPLWAAFQPLALLAAFLVAFKGLGHVKTANVPYVVFALAGLSAWSYFQAAMTIGVPSILSNINLVRYTPCPRVALASSGLISSLPTLALTGGAAVLGAAVTGHLSARVLLLPLAVVWLLLLAGGTVGFLASWTVRYRDINSMLPFMLQLGSFVAPVGYALAGLSPTIRTIVEFNPLTGIIEATRWMLLAGYQPDVTAIVIGLVITLAVMIVGWRTFTSREITMADEI